MAKALKCDRCGAYFDKIVYADDSAIISTHKIFDGGMCIVGAAFDDDEIFHLCDKCQEKLEVFLANRADIQEETNND